MCHDGGMTRTSPAVHRIHRRANTILTTTALLLATLLATLAAIH